jgi:DNA-directed RNA polymerase specialized sigma24 family protein
MGSCTVADPLRRKLLADPALNERLARFVRSKIGDADAGDVVQATLTEALAAKSAPQTEEELTRWIFGIARHELVDHFRKRRREVPADLDEHDEPTAPDSGSAAGLLRWAERELPPGSENQKTLEWMLREGDGEKLEHIAEESRVPPARVRKRVSRLRQHYRARWAAVIAAALVVVVVIVVLALRRRNEDVVAPLPPRETAPLPSAPPDHRADELRELAFDDCDHARWTACLERLDEAKSLDPAGDTTKRVQDARSSATKALAPPPTAPPSASGLPTAVPTVRSTSMVPTATVTATATATSTVPRFFGSPTSN